MNFFVVACFVIGYSFPMSLTFGIKQSVASRPADVDRIVNAPKTYLCQVSRIQGGKMKPIELSLTMGE